MQRILYVFFICVSLAGVISPGTNAQLSEYLTMDPQQARFVYDDIHTFVHAHGLLTPGCDSVAILQSEYLDKGTPGLRMFIEKYDLTAERLVKAIRTHPEKYDSLGDLPDLISAKEPSYREAFVELKRLIPNAVFPRTYFLIGAYRGIGSGSTEGQLISVEKWKRPLEDKRTLLIHELVHFQQVMAVGYDKYKALFGPEKNLLGLSIREGTAEFFANLVTGKITQDEAVDYTLKHERRLWHLFRKEMNGAETGDWMWSKPSDPEQPMHVGYVLGSLIVEAYCTNANDKSKAVREILGVTDYQAFLEQSRYAEKFEE
ncbi:MAG: hypothetical protein JSV84_10215 [Gemmatimonadota bacterium]|nr:MAG: hypothetical protein JSV84_10215 [Gemmatimonadota bacterium]